MRDELYKKGVIRGAVESFSACEDLLYMLLDIGHPPRNVHRLAQIGH